MSATVMMEPSVELEQVESDAGLTAAAATVHELDPLSDPRWTALVEAHPESSIFHTREWLSALKATYGYQPVVYTTSEGSTLRNGMVLCRVNSPITGRRLVSLPFSDHCQPLASGAALHQILRHLADLRSREGLRYVELRPLVWSEDNGQVSFFQSGRTSFQKIDLRPELNTIYRRFHDSCVRRKIKKAEKEGLVYESGRSAVLIDQFRSLMLLTRRRHKLPPQPAAWFRNLAASLGEKLVIHLVSKDGRPAASILTLRHRNQLTYKYGCSDAQFNNLGGTPLLFWKAVQQAKESGAEEFDLGRSDFSDPGLIAFKEHLGAETTELRYYRNMKSRPVLSEETAGKHAWVRDLFARMPDSVLEATGNLLYRHIG